MNLSYQYEMLDVIDSESKLLNEQLAQLESLDKQIHSYLEEYKAGNIYAYFDALALISQSETIMEEMNNVKSNSK